MTEISLIVSTTIFLLIATSTTLCWPLPKNVCTAPVGLRDTTKPTIVVGTGTAASCNESALAAALSQGGTITFDCGSGGQPVTIPITTEMSVANSTDTVIDGGGIVTLDGLGKTRIMSFNRGDFRYPTPVFTVQRLRFINGYCQDGYGGCAILEKLGGTTVIIGCSFENNTGPVVGQDVAGGGVWTLGGGNTTIVGSVFIGNKCSNGGAVGILGSGLALYNSHFENNQATGNGGNPGNGGNGGAIVFDGKGQSSTICGTRFSKNQGNKFGGAFMRVSYAGNEPNNIDNVLVDSNFITPSGNGLAGGFYIQGGFISMTNTTIANNSAAGAGGIFFASDQSVTLNGVNLIGNKAYTELGAAIFCGGGASGVFSGLTVANNYAGAFAAAFGICDQKVTLANSIIVNSTVGSPSSPNSCNTVMNDGKGVIQSLNKQKPATGADEPCTNGMITRTDNVSITLDTMTWKIQATGAQPVYLGPTIVPGL